MPRALVPNAATYLDHRRLLDDKTIDAVIIATPQHLHCEHFVNSIQAGKHVYQEKTMAFTVDHAKRMRAAYRKAPKLTVQVGHQVLFVGPDARCAELPRQRQRRENHRRPHAHVSQHAAWQTAVGAPGLSGHDIRKTFCGIRSSAKRRKRDFDANRYINWRFFWDYSGGNVYENMCHQLSFWYKALNLQIPKAVTMTGGIYLWKDGREVPDTMNVSLEQPEEILVSWDSGFGNNQLGVTEDVLGDRRHHLQGPAIRYMPQKVNRPDGDGAAGPHHAPRQRPHAEFLRLHPLRQGTELPLRSGVPRLHRLPHGGGQLSPAAATMRWDPQKEDDRLIRDMEFDYTPEQIQLRKDRPRICRSRDRSARARVG